MDEEEVEDKDHDLDKSVMGSCRGGDDMTD